MTDLPDWTDDIEWERERGELVMTIHHILTEPTCPSVKVEWENSGEIVCHVHADTLDEAVERALELARKEIPELKEKDNGS